MSYNDWSPPPAPPDMTDPFAGINDAYEKAEAKEAEWGKVPIAK